MRNMVADFIVDVDEHVTWKLPKDRERDLAALGVHPAQIGEVAARRIHGTTTGGVELKLYQWPTKKGDDRMHPAVVHFSITAGEGPLTSAFNLDGASIEVDRLEGLARAILGALDIGRKEGIFEPKPAGGSGGGIRLLKSAHKARKSSRRKAKR